MASANRTLWLHSTGPSEPLDRIHVERDQYLVTIYEARMTSASPTPQVLEYHDKIFLTPEMARWLRDSLNSLDLDTWGEEAGAIPDGGAALTAPAPASGPGSSPRRLGFGDTCQPPMSAADKQAMCDCGHLGSEHQHPLPAPCRHGWDDKATADAMSAEPNLCERMRIYEEAHQRQLAAGACPCIAFSPKGVQ